MREIRVELPNNKYDILIKEGLLNQTGEMLSNLYKGKNIFIVSDTNVGPIYFDKLTKSLEKEGYKCFKYMFEAGETSKTIAELSVIYSFLADNGASRKDLLIALGGGVTGDMAGLAAATYMRGMPYVQIPTTLLAQIDSSIGGKVAVDIPQGKNLVGAFYHPICVLIDPECLNTLDDKYLRDGAAEAVKYGCIKDSELFGLFENMSSIDEVRNHLDVIIEKCCTIKKVIVESDEKESGERMLLNFGHSIGHAIEKYFNYSKYTHGEAVAIGMYEITRISENLSISKPGTTERLKDTIIKLSLPYSFTTENIDIILRNMHGDKKNNSKQSNLIMLKDIGNSFINRIDTNQLDEYLISGGIKNGQ